MPNSSWIAARRPTRTYRMTATAQPGQVLDFNAILINRVHCLHKIINFLRRALWHTLLIKALHRIYRNFHLIEWRKDATKHWHESTSVPMAAHFEQTNSFIVPHIVFESEALTATEANHDTKALTKCLLVSRRQTANTLGAGWGDGGDTVVYKCSTYPLAFLSEQKISFTW